MTDTTPTPDLKAITRTARDPAATAEQLQACAGQGDAIDRLLAKHPNASAQLLEQLSHSSDRATRKAVTLHPNTPKDALLKLAPQFPGDFFQNPAFDWLLIEHPNLMFDIGGGVLKNVLKRAECPQSFMAWAAAHGSEQERLAAAMNPQAQADVLQAIERKGGKAAQAAQQHANHPLASGEVDLESAFRKAVEQEIAESFADNNVPTLAQWPALSTKSQLCRVLGYLSGIGWVTHPLAPPVLAAPMLSALAADLDLCSWLLDDNIPAAPADILSTALTTLAGHPDRGFRRTAADKPATPIEALAKLADDADAWVREGVAFNAATPVNIRVALLESLAGDSDWNVRFRVAGAHATPADTLATLAVDAHPRVRASLAGNAIAPAGILAALAGDADPWVRLAFASNVATLADVRAAALAALSGDADPSVRCSVARNPETPPDVLTQLRGDSRGVVRLAFAVNPVLPVDARSAVLATLANDVDVNVRKAVATDPATPVSVLAGLAGDEEVWVRAAVAQNPATRADTLSVLAGDEYHAVLKEVAKHPSSASEILAKLAGKSDSSVRCAVALNASAPVAVLTKLASDSDRAVRMAVAQHPCVPVSILTKLSVDRLSPVRRGVAANPAAPARSLNTLAGDPDMDVRWAVARNPATPADVLAQLVASSCEELRRMMFDPRRSAWWTSEVAKLKTKDADLIQACNAGNVLFLPDQLADKACRKTELVWRLLGLSHRLASPEDLAKRSRSTEWVERMAVARNPNTPPNIIEALRKDPHRLVARQAEATAALKAGATERQSQLLQEMPAASNDQTDQPLVEETSLRLKKCNELGVGFYGSRWARCLAPGQWLTPLGDSTQAQLERVLPDSLKRAMAEYWADPAISDASFRAVSLPAGVLALLAQISRKKAVQEWIPLKANVPAAALIRLASSKYEDVRANVARCAVTPSDILAKLDNDPVSSVRSLAVRNPAAPIQLLTRLADDAAVHVRWGVAANPTTPADVLDKLAGDADEDVRGAVAANPSTSAVSLAMLAGDSHCRVGFAVAENVSAPPATLSVLAGDADAGVRSAVASNPATPPDILSGLGGDAEAAVRERVAKNPASAAITLHTLAIDSSSPVRCAVAGNPAAPTDVLIGLGGDADAAVREKVAENSATPATVLSVLAGDASAAVRRAVAVNTSTTAHLLPQLASDSDPSVRGAAARSPATPAAIRCAVLTELASDGNWFRRWEVAKNPGTPPDILRILARDAERKVCLAAVGNPSAPEDILITRGGDDKADACRARRLHDLSRALSAASPTPEQSAVVQSWIAELQAGLAEPVVLKDVSDSEFRLAFDALGLMPAEGDKRAIAKAAKSKDWLERAAATYAAGIQPSLLKVLLEDPVEAVRQCAVARLRVA